MGYDKLNIDRFIHKLKLEGKVMNKLFRNINHLFLKSGNLSMGVDHFLVAFPSMLLMAKLVKDNNFSNNSISLILLSTGLCNILFVIITKCTIPIFIGPSFAFIGFMSSTMSLGQKNLDSAYNNVLWGYMLAGLLFLFIAILYKSVTIRKYVKLTLPDALIGPLISLIGLDLLDTAISDAGFNSNPIEYKSIIVAVTTLSVIIFATVFKRKYLKNTSILIGIVIGCIFSGFLFEKFDISNTATGVLLIPNFSTWKNRLSINDVEWLNIFIAVIPATIVVFSENITKITVVEKMIRQDDVSNKKNLSNFYPDSIIGHAFAFIFSIFLGSVPNTIYAQNIALMSVNNIDSSDKRKIRKEKHSKINSYYYKLSAYPYIIAGALAILCSFFSFFQNLLSSIPKAVFGGMELFVFALIAAQGIQLLVDRKVNYKKVTNQIVTSATLLAGLSGIYIDLGVAEIKGLSLALLVGVFFNITFKICAYFGLTNEKLSIIEVVEACISSLSRKDGFLITSDEIPEVIFSEYIRGENRTDQIVNLVNSITYVKILVNNTKNITITKKDEIISMEITPYSDKFVEIINDFDTDTVFKNDNKLIIIINEKMSVHKLKYICKIITTPQFLITDN